MEWNFVTGPPDEKVAALSHELGVNPLLVRLLVQRGIDSFEKARHFFRPGLDQLHDPFLMKDMNLAVERLERAFESDENILVYGDYDVDGTTAVSLVYSFLRTFYANVATYIPDRYKEGYGISYEGIDFASDNDIALIIALDCGIKAVDKVQYAREKGIDLIICDHHRPGKELPEATAVLDPKRSDCEYPYKELCGCGIGFKLIQALSERSRIQGEKLETYLDLVASAIAADIVPITGENRILAFYGLKVINESPRPGIKALTRHMKKDSLTITDVVFTIAPRINAAGRMRHGQFAVDLLTSEDPHKASEIAAEIDRHNTERKVLDRSIAEEAMAQIEENQEAGNFTTVVYNETWHKGVIGIVASRLIEKFYRPTLVFTKSGSKMTGSARSVKGFDVYGALDECRELIDQFGGHKYAAGLTMNPDNYPAFKRKFERVVRDSISEESRTRRIQVDCEVELSDLTPKFYRVLNQFGPFGPGNMKPVFMSSGLRDNGFGKRVGADGEHLKLNLISGNDFSTVDAIGFNLGEKYSLVNSGKPFSAVFTLESNTWNGVTRLQLNLKDLKPET
jgi:single-stranded-DNA-specific exonuclease